MTPTMAEKTTEILIVASGALITLLLGGTLLYWIDREWRSLDAPHREPDNASARPDEKDEPDNVPTDQPPRI
jgi:hypothetical protein